MASAISKIGSARSLEVLAASLVEHERVQGKLSERTAAARTMAKLFFELAALVGSAGVLALFTRSLIDANAQCAALGGMTAGDSIDDTCAALERHFAATPPEDVMPAATTLASCFLAVVSTFIGERLTLQLLQNAWPMIALVKEPK